ncbi:hypothetical protein V6N12_002442 [Hibiscus sabdariffa]|uniref:Uncharacterized protein n=1 Tax=Hibiscus sabdariffa TaxID=183260 RepID=A0ABR2B4A9_9ROSI
MMILVMAETEMIMKGLRKDEVDGHGSGFLGEMNGPLASHDARNARHVVPAAATFSQLLNLPKQIYITHACIFKLRSGRTRVDGLVARTAQLEFLT